MSYILSQICHFVYIFMYIQWSKLKAYNYICLVSSIADHIFVNEIKTEKLDFYLANGFFRNANMLFRSQILPVEGQLNNVINIRLPLANHQFNKRHRKLCRQNEACFTIVFKDSITITPAKEQLFKNHSNRFKGFMYRNLKQLLYGDLNMMVFDSKEINIYAGNKLVAFSFFDIGKKSIASILGVFDQEYEKYSLGTYSMLLEIKWAQDNGFEYYYPGYILDKSKDFDYKLRLGNMEFKLGEDQWDDIQKIDKNKFAGTALENELNKLQIFLKSKKIKFTRYLYPYYSLGHVDLEELPLFVKSPLHIYLPMKLRTRNRIIVEYDMEKNFWVISMVKKNNLYNNYIKQNQITTIKKIKSEYLYVLEYVYVYTTTNMIDIPYYIDQILDNAMG